MLASSSWFEGLVVPGGDELGQQVGTGAGPPPWDEFLEIGVDRVAGPFCPLDLGVRDAGPVGGHDGPYQRTQPLPVGGGDTEQLADDCHRKPEGELGHHVGVTEGGDPVEPLVHQRGDPGSECLQGLR